MKKLASLLVLICFLSTYSLKAGSGGPDAFGYTWKDSKEPGGPTASWHNITTIGQLVSGLGDDNFVGPYPINGFKFYWYNPEKIFIGSNGYISFNPVNIASPFPAAMPLPGSPNDFIAPLLSDLNFAGTGNLGKCYYYSSGDSITISWIDVPFWSPNAPSYTGSNSFQVILNKATKSITFNYKKQLGLTQSNDIAIGIENIIGNIGLAHSFDTYPDSNYTVVYNYPSVVTYSAVDAGVNWNMNEGNGGIFVKRFGPASQVKTNVKNFGNTTINNISVSSQVRDPLNNIISNGLTTITTLQGGQDSTKTMGNTVLAINTGIHTNTTTISGVTGDLLASNNTLMQKIVCVDTTMTNMTLDYTDGIAIGAGISWSGGNGGIGVYMEPPVYPAKIMNTRMYITANAATPVGYYAKIYAANGPNNTPGTLLDSVFVSGSSITTGTYTITPTASSPVITSGGFYILWYMEANGVSLGRNTTLPISRRTYEVLFNQWSDYRSKNEEDFLMGVDIQRVYKRDLSATKIVEPLPNFVLGNNPITVKARIKNVSTDPGISGTIKYRMGNGAIISENFNTVLNPGDSTVYTFNAPLTKALGQNGALCVWIDIANDINKNNDTTCVNGTLATAVKDLNNLGFEVYPNPAKDAVSIKFNEAINNGLTWSLIDIAGRVVLSNKLNSVSSGQTERINIENLNKGIYMLRVNSNAGTHIEKLIVE